MRAPDRFGRSAVAGVGGCAAGHTCLRGAAPDEERSTMTSFSTVICGAGIAGVEAALRLRRLAGDEVQITLIDPGESLVYRPLAVREPFALSGARRYPLRSLIAALGSRTASTRSTLASARCTSPAATSWRMTRCCSPSAAARPHRTSTPTCSTTATRATRSTASCRTSRPATSRAWCSSGPPGRPGRCRCTSLRS